MKTLFKVSLIISLMVLTASLATKPAGSNRFAFTIGSIAGAASDSACGPLPANPSDTVIEVTPSQAGQLSSIVYNASPDTTILLADGNYPTSTLNFHNPRVTLRSQSGNRENVILDGQYSAGEIIYIEADHVTIADLTVKRAYYHAIHVVGGGYYATLYNLHIIDAKEQFVKINPSGGDYTDYGTLACSELELTDTGRSYIEANPTPGFLCYTGGLDAHQSWDWTVRDNTIENIYCTNGGLAEHAIHFWNSSRNPTVERNTILNNARGIGFGLGTSGGQRIYPDDPLSGTGLSPNDVQHIGGVIRNNFVFANFSGFDTGIGLEQAWGVDIYHNTVYSTQGGLGIDIRFENSNPVVKNNLINPNISLRNGGSMSQSAANVSASAGMFVDLPNGDLHLVSTATQAIDKGVGLGGDTSADIDGDSRDAQPDVGADELASQRPAAPLNLRIK